jgi:protein SCO1/2
MRALVLAAVLAVAASGCGSGGGGAAAPAQTGTKPPRFAGAAIVNPTAAPELALRDQHGRPVRLSQQRGRLVLVTFLYTHCPDVCPLIASNLNTALRALGPQRARVRVLAVSVDPKGDTPEAVRAYARRMHLLPQFLYLTGTSAQLTRVWSAYNILAVARKPDLVDHVAYTLLVDRNGKRRVLYDSRVRAQQVVHDLRALMGEKAAG